MSTVTDTGTRAFTNTEQAALAAVRTRLLGVTGAHAKAYYASAVFAMKPLAAPGIGTWGITKSWTLMIDPENLPGGAAGWSVADCASVLEHECNHALRAHADRMDSHAGASLNRKAANIATDAEINDDFDPGSFVARIGILPAKLSLPDGQTAEWYYDNLPPTPASSQQPQCGSGAGGEPLPGEPDDADPSTQPVSAGQAAVIRRTVANAVADHTATYGRGSVPGSLSEWANATLAPPTVPWRRVLRGSIRKGIEYVRGNVDYTYSRLNRQNWVNGGVILPGMHRPVPRIAVVLDTSGSMSRDMVIDCLTEIKGIAAATGTTDVTLIQVDTDVTSVTTWEPGKIELKGRGGTDLRTGIDHAASLRTPINVLIILSDGGSEWPTAPPKGMHVVAAILPTYGLVDSVRKAMPWATVVEVGEPK